MIFNAAKSNNKYIKSYRSIFDMVSNKYPTAITLMSHKAKSSSGNFRAAYEQYNELYEIKYEIYNSCLLYTSPSPRD